MNLLDIATLFSYIALNVDILLQIHQIVVTRSSHDLSLLGLSIRYAAILVIFVKFWSLGEWPLIVGQGLIMVTFTLYLALAVTYLRQEK